MPIIQAMIYFFLSFSGALSFRGAKLDKAACFHNKESPAAAGNQIFKTSRKQFPQRKQQVFIGSANHPRMEGWRSLTFHFLLSVRSSKIFLMPAAEPQYWLCLSDTSLERSRISAGNNQKLHTQLFITRALLPQEGNIIIIIKNSSDLIKYLEERNKQRDFSPFKNNQKPVSIL